MAYESALTQHLKCDVEMNVSGPTAPVVSKWAADALRRLADQIEKEALEDGFHPILDGVGKKIGEVYVDYSEGDEF